MTRPLTALFVFLLLTGCSQQRSTRKDVLTVSVEQQSAWVRNFNPLIPPGSARWPTRAGVYEPLMIWNGVTETYVPWLATESSWSDDHQVISFRLRQDVQWSDGEPFTAADVVFTFETLRAHRLLDQRNVWSYLSEVTALNDHEVLFRFERVFIPGFSDICHQPIVPRHRWASVDNPSIFANPDPVGTGPYTEVLAFRNQVYELGRNPHYWQRDKAQVKSIRFLAYPTNEQANLALIEGEVDWAGNFVPAIEQTFVSRDQHHNHYWFPLMGSMVTLFANTKRAPFADQRVRKALSMAIDREKVVTVAMYGYTRPADGTGLTDAYRAWRDPSVSKMNSWIHFDPEKANNLLDEAGYSRGADDLRQTPNGRSFRFDIIAVVGWSDWVRAAQVIASDLRVLGIEARLRTLESGAWLEKLQKGDFELAVGYSIDEPTPYGYFKWIMSSRTVKPLGELTAGNFHRFGDDQVEQLLTKFERTAEPREQWRIMSKIQARFVELAPVIPLFPNPLWGAYRTERFVGFPNAENSYVKLSPFVEPDCLIVLTELRPTS